MNQTNNHKQISDAINILVALGMPRAQQNERSALCLLALLNLTPGKKWKESEKPLMGITPIMDWAREHYQKEYAPNTRETVRRQTMHQFVDAGIALYNPDKPNRPVNSPKAVYQIEDTVLELLRSFGTSMWHDNLTSYLADRETLAARYAMEREQNRVPVKIAKGKEIILGMSRDPRMGPLLMFGLGGIYTEALKDVSFRLAPLRENEALEMTMDIRAHKLLRGFRGEPPADMPAVAECLLRLSQLVTDHGRIKELDINPLIVYPTGQGAIVADARVILTA
jgi:hypothetical protein